MSTTRRMYCTCCGGGAGRFQQHWNRDTGYGVCRPCALKMIDKDGRDELEQSCGKEGENWASAEQWAELVQAEQS